MELSKRSSKELLLFFVKFSWLGDLVSFHPGVLGNVLPAEAVNPVVQGRCVQGRLSMQGLSG